VVATRDAKAEFRYRLHRDEQAVETVREADIGLENERRFGQHRMTLSVEAT
jgi:hypothetical protein